MWSWRKSFSIPSVAILYSFLSTLTQTWVFWEEGTHTEKMAPIRSNLQTRLEVGKPIPSGLLIVVGRPNTLWVVPPTGRRSWAPEKWNWGSPGEQARKQHAEVSASVLASLFLRFCLPFLHDGRVGQITLYASASFWSWRLPQQQKVV